MPVQGGPLSNSSLLRALVAVSSAALLASACSKDTSSRQVSDENLVRAGKGCQRTIGDSEVRFQVSCADTFAAAAGTVGSGMLGAKSAGFARMLRSALPSGLVSQTRLDRRDVRADSADPVAPAPETDGSLVVGFPVGLLGQQNVFGGVVTAVSDRENQAIGRLKLTDLPPLHVRTVVSFDGNDNPYVVLVGCPRDCTEGSTVLPLMGIPISGFDQQRGVLMLDLSALAGELDFQSIFDPSSEATKLKTKSAAVTAVDYSFSTLVFDVESVMIPKDADPAAAATPETKLSLRWYLKLTSGFDPAFVPREQTAGVGFFTTDRGARQLITRHSLQDLGKEPVHYFLKAVPSEYQPHFARAFDAWNGLFERKVGKKLLSYEFVNAGDPKFDLLVAGDVRFNIVEWDLHNKAPYGGLGPSVANQLTGEIFSANILVQGPSVVELYTKWFQIGAQVRGLRASGHEAEADRVLLEFNRARKARADKLTQTHFKLSLGDELEFRIPSQMVELEDAAEGRSDFDLPPEGMTFEQYMVGYMHDLVAHEMGHNLGLRHNFRGNFGATDTGQHGSVSRSIMEYLGRPFRYLDDLGAYDEMAIAYGYKGVAPQQLNWFCTDEDVPHTDDAEGPKLSAECSRDDATSDPFGWLLGRLDQAVKYLVAPETTAAPEWTPADMERELGIALSGIASYAASADTFGSTWTAFFKPGRPADASSVPQFVIEQVKARVSSPEVAAAIAGKQDQAARDKAQANLDALRVKATETLTKFGVPVGSPL